MVQCCVYSCFENSSNKSQYILHKFPINNQKLCQLWLKKCGRHNTFNLKNAKVCSKHFSDEQYQKCIYMEFELNGCGPRKLLENAIPDMNLPLEEMKPGR